MILKGNDLKIFNAIRSVHTVKGHPSALWVLKGTTPNGRMATFYDLNEPSRPLTVDWKANHAVPLHQYKVFTLFPINQEAIDKATDATEEPPKPIMEWQVVMKILDMLQRKEVVHSITGGYEANDLAPETIVALMKEFFTDYDDEVFKIYHMKRVWGWYLIMKKYADALPEFVPPAVADETPAVEDVPKVE